MVSQAHVTLTGGNQCGEKEVCRMRGDLERCVDVLLGLRQLVQTDQRIGAAVQRLHAARIRLDGLAELIDCPIRVSLGTQQLRGDALDDQVIRGQRIRRLDLLACLVEVSLHNQEAGQHDMRQPEAGIQPDRISQQRLSGVELQG